MPVHRSPLVLVVVLLVVICGAMGMGWLPRTPSNEELMADTARYMDCLRGAISVEGLCWWTPNYLGGHSLAPMLVALTGVVGFSLLATILSPLVSALTAFKIAGLIIVFLSGLSMFFCLRRLSGQAWIPVLGAVLYATSAQFALRLAVLEHVALAVCFIFPPLLCHLLLRLNERPTHRDELFLAMAVSAFALGYTKLLVLFLPALSLFALSLIVFRRDRARAFCVSVFRAALLTIPLGLLPLLPTFREFRWMAVFEMEPFAGWQANYSFFSALTWVDIGNLLTQSSLLPSVNSLKHPHLDFYFGVFCFTAIILGLLAAPAVESPPARTLRRWFYVLLGIVLLSTWLSCGPRSVLSGHLAFLSFSSEMPHPLIALIWALLVIQGWILWRILPAGRGKVVTAIVLLIIYYFVPGFRLLEILPIFQHVRAPNSLWAISGPFAVCASAALAVYFLWHRFPTRLARAGLASAGILLLAADLTAVHRAFYRPGLPAETFPAFDQAQDFLRKAPVPGKVLALSGRYFYLVTPEQSGRAVATEALGRHFQLRWARYMEMGSYSSAASLSAYLAANGIGYILIDSKDPELDEQTTKILRKLYPVVFENDYFTLLENKASLAPGFFTSSVKAVAADAFLQPIEILREMEAGRMPIEPPLSFSSPPSPAPPVALQAVADRSTYQRIVLQGLPKTEGIVVATTNFHPDWRAYGKNGPLPVGRAGGNLLACQAGSGDEWVEFRFEAPAWYSWVVGLSGLSWVLSLGLVTFSGIGPARWRQRFTKPLHENLAPIPMVSRSDAPLKKPIVIIPTFNEAGSISSAIDEALAADPGVEVLVVDDNSPDGTAEIVAAHRDFGQRVHLLKRLGKLGLGSAYKEGFHWAIERDYDAIIEMDADLSHDPKDIPRLLHALENGCDAVIGSRYLDGVRVMNWPQERLFLSTGASKYLRVILGLPLTDGTSGFKALRSAAVRDLDWKQFHAEGYGFQIELHFFLWQGGARLKEIPIIFTERNRGKTKMTAPIAIEAALRVLQLAFSGAGGKNDPLPENQK